MPTLTQSKIVSAEEAVRLIPDGASVAISGFATATLPDYLASVIEKTFLETAHPRDLTLFHTAGIGNWKGRGSEHFAHEGLLRRIIAGHYAFAPKLQSLIINNVIEGYNLPQGALALLIRDIAGGRPGTMTKIGMGTFVDPRNQGGKMNDRTTEDLVEVINLLGEEWLFYRRVPIQVALIKATYADTNGNLSGEHLPLLSSINSMAQAAHNSGGIVIAQVDGVVREGSLDPRLVKVPGYLVDAVVVAPAEEQFMTELDPYQAAYCGDVRVPVNSITVMPLTERKVIARRAYLELDGGGIVNLGIGMPEGVANVAAEEGTVDKLNLTVESGVNGGVPESGVRFGVGWNPDMITDEATQFDFYDGGGLDGTFIGLAQMDRLGNINVSRFGPKISGCGGAINITQSARRVVFCGTFTARGLEVEVANGELRIVTEGATRKLVEDVEQVTFSGEYARSVGQPALYITERAVFEMTAEGLMLTEIAPGIDLERDVIAQMEFTPNVSPELRLMDPRIFADGPMFAHNPEGIAR